MKRSPPSLSLNQERIGLPQWRLDISRNPEYRWLKRIDIDLKIMIVLFC